MAFKCYDWNIPIRMFVTVGAVLKIFVALRKSGIFQIKLEACDEI